MTTKRLATAAAAGVGGVGEDEFADAKSSRRVEEKLKKFALDLLDSAGLII
jgi:hypothetical protein